MSLGLGIGVPGFRDLWGNGSWSTVKALYSLPRKDIAREVGPPLCSYYEPWDHAGSDILSRDSMHPLHHTVDTKDPAWP